MILFYQTAKTSLLLKEPTTDLIEFQSHKVNLYLQLAKTHGSDFIEIDRKVEFYLKQKKISVRVDVVVYDKNMNAKKIYILINPKAPYSQKMLIHKYGNMAGVALKVAANQVYFLYPISNEGYDNKI